ncbi:MAG: Phosphoesterase PA-phosphatase related protein [Parcubacteria group bacterium GW2011_GWC1_42_11]|nr:MAG: Phosphoesterase PA-phosphatase related protein [Parcubacteria group bacterium GW2011_GWC1_42_11]
MRSHRPRLWAPRGEAYVNNMNETIFNFFYSFAHKSYALDFCIHFFAEWYGLIILFVLFIYLFKHRDNPKKGVRDLFVVGTTAVSAWFIAHFFKDVFHTLRPFDAVASIKPLVIESGYAFPSGHATFFMALASSLWFYHKRLAVFFGISAVLIGVARISAGIHWPIDILAGLFLGYAIGTTLHDLISSMTSKVYPTSKPPIAK